MRRLSLCLLAFFLAACAIPVRPIARVVPDQDGGAHFERDADREPSLGAAGAGLMQLLAVALPSPWRELAAALAASLVAGRAAKRAPEKALQQTVAGIEAAKQALPDDVVEKLHASLASSQDERTKRLVWEIRP